MAYTKQTWANGDVITSAKLTHMEDGIAQGAIAKDAIAPEFSTSTSYAIGDYCLYQGTLYRFTSPHSGAWRASDVVATDVCERFAEDESVLFSNATIGTITTGKYVNGDGDLSNDVSYDVCDYVDISDFSKVEFSVSMNSARGLAFYSESKTTLLVINGNNCSSYGYTASSVPQLVKLDVPDGAKYLRFTRRNAYDVTTAGFAVSGISISGLVKQVNELRKDVDSIDVTGFVEKSGTNQVTVQNAEFLDTVYINAFDGNYIDGFTIAGSGFNPSGYYLGTNASRYNGAIIPIKPNTKYTLCCKTNSESKITLGRAVTSTKILETSQYFDGSVYVNFESATTNQTFNVFTSGANDKYLYVYGLNYTDPNGSQFIQLYEGETNIFTTNQYNVSYGVPNDKLVITSADCGIVIKPISATRFNVKILDEGSKEWITHTFLKTYTTHTIDGNSVVTENCWRAEYIKDFNGNNIMQGNTNYIHSLDETDHVGHVGAGHGCAVAVWTLFFADGQQFTPETLDHEIRCSCFRMTEKVNHYLIDQTATTSSSDAIPTIENGNPVIESVEYLDAEWTINNRMKMRNRLDVVKNGIKFNDCFAGMIAGYYPYFDHIIINNPEYIYNELSGSDSNITVSNIGGTSTVISQLGSMDFSADEVILFGDKYRCSTRIIANDPMRYSKLNIESASLPPNADNRIKFYFVPCICSPSAEAEVFNTGAILDVMIIKELDVVK